MKIGTQFPGLEGAIAWFGGTQAHAESEIAGRPTLIHFWSVSCDICKDNLPLVGQWRDEKRDQGLRVIGIHLPRFQSDLDAEAIRDAIAKYGMTEPIALDHMHRMRDTFGNEEGYVPAYYLFDAEGKLKGSAVGQRGLEMLKSAIDRLFPAVETVTESSAINAG